MFSLHIHLAFKNLPKPDVMHRMSMIWSIVTKPIKSINAKVAREEQAIQPELAITSNNGCLVKRRLITHTALLLSLLVLFTQSALSQDAVVASSFTECSAKAFLIQGKQPSTYAINLTTGDYNVAALSHGTSSPLNAVGYSIHDHKFYGWSSELGQPVLINSDWQIEQLPDTNTTTTNFSVGDVSLLQNRYYVYRDGRAYGLFSIGLDPDASDYLEMTNIIDGAELSLDIHDMAFHPFDGFAYAVDSEGILHKIDVDEGSSENLGSVGETGVFGAAYFDLEGNFYIGRNNDGIIFRIAVDSGVYQSEIFATGPAAGTNDGARCARAPLSEDADELFDFGDAPDSYSTSLENDGARHVLTQNPTLFLGDGIDGESDSSFYPLSDDTDNDTDDETGIQFVTNIVEIRTSIVVAKTSGTGFLNGWVDFNRDGSFDTTEQIINDQLVTAGVTPLYFQVPTGVSIGQSWARFRIASVLGTLPTGIAHDGEVEDYPITISQNEEVATTYPSANEWSTVAFEDTWPYLGDYDMNDLVFYLRNTVFRNDLGVTRVVIEGELAAAGASYANGFGIRLPGVLRSQVDEENIELTVNGRLIASENILELNRREAILILAEDIDDFVASAETCSHYRVEAGCGSKIELFFSISVPMQNPVQAELSGVFDPFLFATPGQWRGRHFLTPPGRSFEIHLKNQAPTEAFNLDLFASVGHDVSSASNGQYFLSEGGMPWAIEVGHRWKYPLEQSEITEAYPLFRNFVESSGVEDRFWYNTEVADFLHVFTN